MSPYEFWNSGASIFYVNGSNGPGYLSAIYLKDAKEVVRLSNFSLIKTYS